MKRFTCAVFALTSVLAGIQPLPAQVQGQWTGTGAMQSTRELDAQVRLISGRVLAMGGVDNSNTILSSAEVYNPGPGTWTLTGSMSAARNLFPAVVLTSGKVLVAGGEGQSISCGKACTSYIPTAKADIYNEAAGKFTATSSLSRARAYHSATLLGTGRVLVDGGVGYNAYCCIVLGSAESYTALTLTFSASTLTFGVF